MVGPAKVVRAGAEHMGDRSEASCDGMCPPRLSLSSLFCSSTAALLLVPLLLRLMTRLRQLYSGSAGARNCRGGIRVLVQRLRQASEQVISGLMWEMA